MAARLGGSYEDNQTDPETLRLQKWFGQALRPFLMRLVEERPRAAQVLVRLAYVWAQDMNRRSALARTSDHVAPSTVVLEPTSRCNLNCPGCYAKSTNLGEDMSYEALRDTVAEVQAMGTTLITLSGGEPFLREQRDQAVTRLAAEFPDLGFLVYTNGTLIDDPVAERLGRLGNVFPAISIEGGEEESDARRGKTYYSRTHRVRRLLADYEVMYGFSATVTSQNAELIAREAFVDERIAQGDLFGWYFIIQPIGRAPDTSLMVTPQQRARLRDTILGARVQGKPIFLGDFWNDGPFVQGCMAGGRNYFHIYANGDISPCVFSPVACGNMHDILSGKSEYRSLGDFMIRHPFFRGFRDKQEEITDWRAPCMLIDHPDKFRALCAQGHWYPAKNMPQGYLDGDIAHEIDRISCSWCRHLSDPDQSLDALLSDEALRQAPASSLQQSAHS